MKDPFSLPEDAVAQPVIRKLLEADVQEACVAYTRRRGYWARKFSSPSQRSVPDYEFAKNFANYVQLTTQQRGHAVKWAEEFKAPGKRSTDAQTKEQNLMVAAGWTVYRDTGTNGQADIDAFKARIDELERLYG